MHTWISWWLIERIIPDFGEKIKCHFWFYEEKCLLSITHIEGCWIFMSSNSEWINWFMKKWIIKTTNEWMTSYMNVCVNK